MDEFVSTKQCKQQHNATKWLLTVLIALMGLFVAGASWAVTAGWASVETTGKVEMRLQKTEIEQSHVVQILGEIRTQQRADRKLLEEILLQQRRYR